VWVLSDNTARTRWLRRAVRGTVMLIVLPCNWLTGVAKAKWKRNMHRDQWLGIW
jgi:hypothetical protein